MSPLVHLQRIPVLRAHSALPAAARAFVPASIAVRHVPEPPSILQPLQSGGWSFAQGWGFATACVRRTTLSHDCIDWGLHICSRPAQACLGGSNMFASLCCLSTLCLVTLVQVQYQLCSNPQNFNRHANKLALTLCVWNSHSTGTVDTPPLTHYQSYCHAYCRRSGPQNPTWPTHTLPSNHHA